MLYKIIVVCFLIVLLGCSQNEFNQQNTLVPYTIVNASTYPDPSFTSTPGDFQIVPGQGYNGNGIIVFNIDTNIFLAYDLTCPYVDPDDCDSAMEVDMLSGEMICEDCANDDIFFTQYQNSVTIGDGDNTETYYLRQYSATLEGNVVRITNF